MKEEEKIEEDEENEDRIDIKITQSKYSNDQLMDRYNSFYRSRREVSLFE